ncbi:unnamed protein product, partial [Tilletia caries]
VNIPAASGDMDILAAHMPSVEELKPDLVATRHRSVRPPSDDFLNKYINRYACYPVRLGCCDD